MELRSCYLACAAKHAARDVHAQVLASTGLLACPHPRLGGLIPAANRATTRLSAGPHVWGRRWRFCSPRCPAALVS